MYIAAPLCNRKVKDKRLRVSSSLSVSSKVASRPSKLSLQFYAALAWWVMSGVVAAGLGTVLYYTRRITMRNIRQLLCKFWKPVLAVVLVVFALLVIAAQIKPPCLWRYVVWKRYPKLIPEDRTDVTLVSAYFNLGNLAQEKLGLYKYLQWAQAFQFVMNPLVFYTDSEQMANLLTRTRPANTTKVIHINRSELQAFASVEKIRSIFQDPDYPKHHPNTVVPEYPCSQHAKYELVRRALDTGYFSNNKYVAWIDTGYFRHLGLRQRRFFLVVPPGMDDRRIAMTQISPPDSSLLPSDIFRQNLFWVGGGFSLGTRSTYRQFALEYEACTERFLQQGLSNTDQQVIYSMFTSIHRLSYDLNTAVQTYRWTWDSVCYCWFYLGFYCYREID